MNKAVFLDRDGTINVDKHYLYKIDEFEYLPGVKEGLRDLCAAGYLLIIVTNQSGIGRGYYTEKDYHILNDWMMKDLKDSGVEISASYYCPHLKEADVEEYRKDCDCRKPGVGLFEKAVKEFDIDLEKSFAIGDKIRDLEICISGINGKKARGYLVYSKPEMVDDTDSNVTCISGGIADACKDILSLR